MIIGTVLPEGNFYNGIYNTIRLKLVELGHIPDRANYANEGLYNTAVEALRNTGKTIISVRNANTGINRGEMKNNVFYINSISRNNGDYGGGKAVIEEYKTIDNQTRFRRVFMPSKPQDITVEISYKTDNIKMDILMRTILLTVLGERSYINAYSDDGTAGDAFLLMFTGEVNMDSGNQLDKRARFVAKDLILITPLELENDIMPASEITVQLGDSEVLNELPTEE